MSKLGQALYELRGERTQEAFAALLGVHQSVYSRWERGSAAPSFRMATQIVERLGLTMEAFEEIVERQCNDAYWRARRWDDMVTRWKSRVANSEATN